MLQLLFSLSLNQSNLANSIILSSKPFRKKNKNDDVKTFVKCIERKTNIYRTWKIFVGRDETTVVNYK